MPLGIPVQRDRIDKGLNNTIERLDIVLTAKITDRCTGSVHGIISNSQDIWFLWWLNFVC
jgi:hypothetical protein